MHLRQLFSTFPRGWPGIGLLLLRLAIGIPALLQGAACLSDRGDSCAEHRLVSACFALAGSSLILGFLTPVVSGAMAIGVAASWLPLPGPSVFIAAFDATFLVPVAVAVALLGPGALSIDARLFGRREIIIPRR